MLDGLNSTVDSSLCNVTPALAQVWLTNNLYEKQRPRRPAHVSYLAGEIRKGRFIAGTAIHFAKKNGHDYLVNGQHTLAAIIAADTSLPLTITTSSVQTDLEIAELYFRHDNHLTRQISDAFRALDLDQETGLCLTQQQWVGSAVYVIKEGFLGGRGVKQRISRDDLAEGVIKLALPARRYFYAITNSREYMKRALTRRATLSIGLTTFKYCDSQAYVFWEKVATGDALKTGDPRKTLAEFLIEISTMGGGMQARRVASTSYHCRAVSAAWNAFMEDRELKIIKVVNETSPIKILGTPYLGERIDYDSLL